MPSLERNGDGSALAVRAERVGSAVVLDLEGRLTVDSDTHRLAEIVGSQTRLGARHVVMHLGAVQQLDCSGLGQLVQLRNQVCGCGGTFALIIVERHQRRLLELLGLLAVFTLFESRHEALRWCLSPAVSARGLSTTWLTRSVRGGSHAVDVAFERAC